MRDRHSRLELTTSCDILSHLVEQSYVSVDISDNKNKNYKSALRAVQRYLSNHGFKRGLKNNKIAIAEKQSLVDKRNEYIHILFENRKQDINNRLREVYLDESYIHHHYRYHNNMLYDPNDAQNIQPNLRFKGQRLYFIAAIQESNPNVRNIAREDDMASIVPNSVHSFEYNKKGDYHNSFNNGTFGEWFRNQLLPNLKQKSLIIMDNAAYHKSLPPDTPNTNKSRKRDILDKLREVGLECEENVGIVELKKIYAAYIRLHVKPVLVQLAESQGHRVIFTPPYHSNLQPIEIVWANIKSRVGRQYTSTTTFSDVKSRLVESFQYYSTQHELINSIIKHIDKELKSMLNNNNSNNMIDTTMDQIAEVQSYSVNNSNIINNDVQTENQSDNEDSDENIYDDSDNSEDDENSEY